MEFFKEFENIFSLFGLNFKMLLGLLIFILILGLAVYILISIFLNKFNKLLYGKGTFMAWIPVFNIYLLGKLTINKIFGFLLVAILVLSSNMTVTINGVSNSYSILPSQISVYISSALSLGCTGLLIYAIVKYFKIKKNGIVSEKTTKTNNKHINNKRKIDSFKIEFRELQPVTIGFFESRKATSIGVVVVLISFLLFIIFLPNISGFINNIFDKDLNNTLTPSNPNNIVTPNEDPEKEDIFKIYTDNMDISNEEIKVSQIFVNKIESNISYKITNLGNKTNIESLNYYVEIYNSERTLMERVKLVKELSLTKNYTSNIIATNLKTDTVNDVGYIVLIKKSVSEYPEVTLTSLEDGTNLVCTKDNEKVIYKFEEGALKQVLSEISYKNTDNNYEENLEQNEKLVRNYNNKEGIFSRLIRFEEGYNIITEVDLNSISDMYIFNADTFKLNTIPKVVNFEMEAQGFSCE